MCKAMRDSGVMQKLVSNQDMTRRVAEAGWTLARVRRVNGACAPDLRQGSHDRNHRSSESLLADGDSCRGIKESLAKHMQKLSQDPEAMSTLQDGMPAGEGLLRSDDSLSRFACVVLRGGDAEAREVCLEVARRLCGCADRCSGRWCQRGRGVLRAGRGARNAHRRLLVLTPACCQRRSKRLRWPICATPRAAAADFYRGAGRAMKGDTFLPAGAFAGATSSRCLPARHHGALHARERAARSCGRPVLGREAWVDPGWAGV